MQLQCANRDCRRRFDSSSQGRLFQFEIVSISVSTVDDKREDGDETPKRETSQFWLCGPCSETMTLTLEPVEGLKLQPIDHSFPESRNTVVRETHN